MQRQMTERRIASPSTSSLELDRCDTSKEQPNEKLLSINIRYTKLFRHAIKNFCATNFFLCFAYLGDSQFSQHENFFLWNNIYENLATIRLNLLLIRHRARIDGIPRYPPIKTTVAAMLMLLAGIGFLISGLVIYFGKGGDRSRGLPLFVLGAMCKYFIFVQRS
jgi:hypothetical protein